MITLYPRILDRNYSRFFFLLFFFQRWMFINNNIYKTDYKFIHYLLNKQLLNSQVYSIFYVNFNFGTSDVCVLGIILKLFDIIWQELIKKRAKKTIKCLVEYHKGFNETNILFPAKILLTSVSYNLRGFSNRLISPQHYSYIRLSLQI